MLGRGGIQVVQKAGEDIELLLLAAGAACGCDLGQPPVHLDHHGRVALRGRREAMRGEAEIAGLLVELDDLVLLNLVRGGHRVEEEPLSEAHLHRLEERRQAALDEVCDGSELFRRTGLIDLGKDPDQLVALGRGLHPIEVGRQLAELHR